MAYKDVQALLKAVEARDGVLTMSMGSLRDTCGFQRLRKNVVLEISSRLHKAGLSHIPRKLVEDQAGKVRLYKPKTPVGDIIKLVMTVGKENDEKLRELADGDAAVLERVRKLVNGKLD